MTEKQKLWVVTELFFPEETSTAYIMTKISEHLAQSSEVGVICGPSSYQKSNLRSAGTFDNEKVKIYRVNTLALNKDKLLQRSLRMLLLSVQLSFKLLTKARKGDRVLIVTNPAPVVLLVSAICRLKGLKCITIVHDVFPENLVAARLMAPGSMVYRFLKSVFNNAYRRMSVLLVLGRDMQEIFEEKLHRYKKKPAIHVVENWADTTGITPREKNENSIVNNLGISDKIIFQFAGNLGRVQGLMELCQIIKNVRNPLVHFMFIGEGAVKKEMQDFVAAHKLTNVSMLPSFARNQQPEFLNACDIGIVSLQEGMAGLGVPSKSYNILAAGKPILFIGSQESEIARMIHENEVGWCYEAGESRQLLDFFNSLSAEDARKISEKGARARALAVDKYAQEIILNKYLKMTLSEN